MANCICCGKKIKFSEMSYNLEYLYWGDACSECHKKWIDNRYIAAKMVLEHTPEEVVICLAENGFTVIDENQDRFKKALIDFKDNASKVIVAEEINNSNGTDEERRKIIENHQKMEQERREKLKQDLDRIIVTMSFNVEGYKITRYLDVISGACVIGTGAISEFSASLSDLLGTESNAFADKLNIARESALLELRKKCLDLKANGIINVAFSYVTFANNMIGVIVNGTAVMLEAIS